MRKVDSVKAVLTVAVVAKSFQATSTGGKWLFLIVAQSGSGKRCMQYDF